jgi:hypothetical protein
MTNFNKTEQSSRELESGAACVAPDHDVALLTAVRKELDQSCAALDGYTLSRLHRMRVVAVAKRGPRLSRLLVPFGGLVTAFALVVAVSVGWNARKAETSSPAAMEDMEILAGNEALDFYADYDFYQWLAQD